MSFPSIFKDSPGRTNLLYHDVEVGDNKPIKQYPYRINPTKAKIIADEVDYMLTNKLIKPSFSPWSSPVVLVPKPNNQFRLCLDYRKVNAITKTDSYPLPRVDDCVDRIGNAHFISKFDLLKGYWQVPLTERVKEISAFITHNGLYQCSVMPFGMKNAASTFQRLMNIVCSKVKNCVVYIDNVVIYSNSWEDHLQSIHELFKAIQNANMVINLAKSDFSQVKITYLGFEVGYGKVLPKESNIQAILDFPVPKTRKNIRQFIGLAGYYRKFVLNFSDIVCPLTNLLKKNVNFNWDDSCDISFKKLKSILISHPVLMSPNFSRDFELSIDASDTGIGAMLCQKDDLGESHPVAFFSKKLNEPQRKYSTIEKETLALIAALNHFEVYVTSNPGPLVIYTDHNPLKFLNRFQNKNQRLTRWSLFLQEYDLDIRHIKGKDNIIPDVLSRT